MGLYTKINPYIRLKPHRSHLHRLVANLKRKVASYVCFCRVKIPWKFLIKTSVSFALVYHLSRNVTFCRVICTLCVKKNELKLLGIGIWSNFDRNKNIKKIVTYFTVKETKYNLSCIVGASGSSEYSRTKSL